MSPNLVPADPGGAGDLDRLQRRAADTAGESLAPATRRSYQTSWQQWQDFADAAGFSALPAHPATVAMWAQRLSDGGARADTVAVRLAAVGWAHRHTNNPHGRPYENPVDDPRVAAVVSGLRRRQAADGSARRQAAPLSDQDVRAVEETARTPRVRGRRVEAPDRAEARSCADIALVRLLRDGMLRIGEAADARWEDLNFEASGSATLNVRRSKTDQDGDGAVVWLSPATASALERLRSAQGASAGRPGARVMGGVSVRTLSRRLAAAFAAAGLTGAYSGHSGRVGMAHDLAASGAGMSAIMAAGRWKSPSMPARYTARQAAERGAVAEFYRLGTRRAGSEQPRRAG